MTAKEQVHGMIFQAEKVYTEISRKCTGSSTDFHTNKGYFDQEGYQSDNYKQLHVQSFRWLLIIWCLTKFSELGIGQKDMLD